MDRKVNWDVLYCLPLILQQGNPISKEASPSSKYKDRGCRSLLFCSKHTNTRGSIVVEACLCVPVFFLVLFSLFYIIEILSFQLSLQRDLVKVADTYAVYGTKAGVVIPTIEKKVLVRWKEKGPQKICYTSYTKKIPCLGSEFIKIPLYQQVVIHDYKGLSMIPKEKIQKDEYVYIAEHATVYHINKICTYLKPQIQEIDFFQVEKKRNQSQGKYYACRYCCKSTKIGKRKQVYITPYGNRYHLDNTCGGIARNIRRVRKSEVRGLPKCSKCECSENIKNSNSIKESKNKN